MHADSYPSLALSPAQPTVVRRVTAFLLTDGTLHFGGALYEPFNLAPQPPVAHPLIDALAPVHSKFQAFLTDEDAVQLLRVGRSTALLLLPGFTFRHHVFQASSMQRMRWYSMKTFYDAYDLRPTHLSVPVKSGNWKFPVRSPFPSSLTALLFSPEEVRDPEVFFADSKHGRSVFSAEDSRLAFAIDCPWTRLRERLSQKDSVVGKDEWYRILTRESSIPVRELKQAQRQRHCELPALPPGILPNGLRRLQFSCDINTPLQLGSLPSTIEVLQFDSRLRLPLTIGTVPSSLIYLFLYEYNAPLLPGVLPPPLEHLRIDDWNYPLTVGVLPSSLKALGLTTFNKPLLPDVLPPGITHLRLCHFTHEVGEGVLPPSLFSLDLGHVSQRSLLLPFVLPTSLRVLFLHTEAGHPLKGLLPNGLETLHWSHRGDHIDLVPRLLPNTLHVLNLSWCQIDRIVPHSIPASVKDLVLPRWFAIEGERADLVLPEGVDVYIGGER